MGKFVAEIVRRHSIAHLTERPYPLSRNLPGALLRQHYLSNLRLKLKNKEITPEAFAHLKSVPPPLPQMPPIAGERARLSVPLAKKPPRPRSLNRKKRNRNKRRSSKLPKEMEHALSQALQAKMTAVRASWAGFPLSLHTTSLASESFSSPLPSPLESPLSQKALGKKDSKQHKKSERPPPMSATKVIYFDDNPETDYLPMNVKHVALRKEGRGIIGEGNAKELLASKDINFSKLTSRDVLIWDFDCTLSAIHLYKTMHMTTSKSWEGSWGAKLLVWWRESHPEDVSEEMSATELLDRIQKDPGLWNEFVMGFVFDSYLPRLRSFLLEASECKHVILSRGRAEEVAMALLTTKLNKFFSCVVDCSGCYYWPKEDFELGDTKVVYDDSREKLLAAAFESKNCDEVYDKDRWIAKELETGWRRAIPGYAHGELHAAIAASIRKRVKRHLLAKEIQTTEKAYVEKLKLMLEAHMQLSENDHELVSFADISSIFSNMKELVDISMVFLLHLEQLLDHWDDEHTCLGPLFIAFADYFKLYSRYASSFDSADEVLSKLLANPNAAAIEAILEKLKLGGPNFRNILIMPVQRVPRYKLFLVELLKNTPDHLADHVFLQQALIDIGNAAKYINQHVSLTTGLIQGIKLCNRFRPTIPWLVQGDRGVVHKGTLRKRGTGINQTLKNRYFVLFSDRLFLYCRQHQADNIEKMHFTNPRPVALVGIESLVRRGGEVMPALKYQTLDDVFSLPAYIPKGLAKTEPKDLITREEILNLYSPSKDLFWVCAKGENTQFWFDAGDQGNFDEWMEAFAYVFTPKKTTYLRETAKLQEKKGRGSSKLVES